MRKVVLMAITLTLLLVSCKNDIYIPQQKGVDICRVEHTYFPTIQEAADSITVKKESKAKAISENKTIHLLEDVTEAYLLSKRSGLRVPSDYESVLKMDFENHEYFFSNRKSEDHFFEVLGGNDVEIATGTSVILETSAPDPAAIKVNTKIVCLCDHCIDDRRKKPHAIEIGSEGELVIEGESKLNGDAVVDGGALIINSGEHHFDQLVMENGAEVDINGGVMVFDDINGDGKVDMTGGDVTIMDIDKSDECEIEISGGTIRDPHPIDDKIVPAITDPENVVHIIIHEWDVVEERILKEPTCTEDGLRYVYYKCHYCPATLVVDREVIPALGHNYEEWDYNDEEHWHKCTRCGYIADVGKHNSKTVIQDGAAGHHFVCTVCGYATGIEEHIFVDRVCTVCGYTDQTGSTGGGGFEVEIEYKQPLGYLESEKTSSDDKHFRIYFVNDANEVQHYHHKLPSKYEWSVIGQECSYEEYVDEDGIGGIMLEKKYKISHQVKCVYSNDNGVGECSIVV